MLPWYDIVIVIVLFGVMFKFVIPYLFPNHVQLARSATQGGYIIPSAGETAVSRQKADRRRVRHASDDYDQ